MPFSLAPSRRRSLLCLALLTAAVAAPSCKKDEQDDKRFLRVSLLGGVASSGKAVNAASVTIKSGGVTLSTVCVNTATSTPGESVASVVLSRVVSRNLNERVTIEVAPYESLRGSDVSQPGIEFVCDDTLPDPLTAPQSVDINFCDSESREVVFYLGADCCTNGTGGSVGAAGASGSSGAAGTTGGSSGSSGQAGSAGATAGAGAGGVAGNGGTAGAAGNAGGEAGASGSSAGDGGEAGAGGAGGEASGSSGQGGGSGSGLAGFAQSGGTAASMVLPPHGPGLRVQAAPAPCCNAGRVCGAGVTTTGTRCGKNECCSPTVDACVLEPTN